MDKILSLMGFTKKAGKIVTGANAVIRSILSEESSLVIISEDAGGSVKKKILRLCEENNIPFKIYGKSDDFAAAIGEENKVIFSIVDENFSKRFLELMEVLISG